MATPDDDPPDAAAPPPDDTRAKDLSAGELAELAAWFALPSAVVVQEQQQRAAEESLEEKEWRETRERRDAAAAAADPAFVEWIFRHATKPPPFEPLPPVKLTISDHIVLPLVRRELERLDTTDPLLQTDERPYGVPPDIVAAVSNDNAPQAILRDLYRPESTYELRFESPFDELPDLDPLAAVREALRTNLAVEWLGSPLVALTEARKTFKDFLREDWSVLGPEGAAWRNAPREGEGR